MGSAGAEKFYKFSPNLTELLFNGPAERAERAEILLPCGLWDMLSRLRREPTELKCL